MTLDKDYQKYDNNIKRNYNQKGHIIRSPNYLIQFIISQMKMFLKNNVKQKKKQF